MRFTVLATVAAMVFWLSGSALAQAPAVKSGQDHCKLPSPVSATHPATPAAKVIVGMHVLRLTNLDVTNNQFTLDFWLWFRWTDDSLKPYQTFELVNGKIDTRQVERVDKVGSVNYACVRVIANVTCFWDVSRFPLGKQHLTVEIEDNDLDGTDLVFEPDNANCGMDSNFHFSGWQAKSFGGAAVNHAYATNYGDPRATSKGCDFSRAVFTLEMNRTDVFHSFKVFAALYLSALVAFTSFFVKPDQRLGLMVGAIFAVVTSHTVISSYLPEAGVLTLADHLHLVTAGVIIVSLFETAYSLHLLHQQREKSYKRLDRMTFWITMPIFLTANVLLLLLG